MAERRRDASRQASPQPFELGGVDAGAGAAGLDQPAVKSSGDAHNRRSRLRGGTGLHAPNPTLATSRFDSG